MDATLPKFYGSSIINWFQEYLETNYVRKLLWNVMKPKKTTAVRCFVRLHWTCNCVNGLIWSNQWDYSLEWGGMCFFLFIIMLGSIIAVTPFLEFSAIKIVQWKITLNNFNNLGGQSVFSPGEGVGRILNLSCPGTGRAVVKTGHSNLRPGSKELSSGIHKFTTLFWT